MAPSFAGIEIMDADEMPSDYGKWLIHGPQGSGKTTLASSIAELGPTLFIDLTGEKGIRSFQGAPYARNIKVIRPASIMSMDDIFWQLAKGGHPFKAVVVDSLTAVQKMAMRYLLGHDETAVKEIQQGTAPADMRTWGQGLDIMTDVATFWYGLADGNREHPMHVVMTAQTKIDDDRRQLDVQRGALSITMATPDYVLYTDTEENLDEVGENGPEIRHIVRFGSDPEYRIKARLPYSLRGRIPAVLGRKRPTKLSDLSSVLGIGGVPARATAKKAAPSAAEPVSATTTTS